MFPSVDGGRHGQVYWHALTVEALATIYYGQSRNALSGEVGMLFVGGSKNKTVETCATADVKLARLQKNSFLFGRCCDVATIRKKWI